MSEKSIALVTGANKGLGFETSRRLAQNGIRVLLGARDARKGESAAKALQDEGLDAAFVELDITNPDHIQQVFTHIQNTYGKLDILVNNAGMISPDEALFSQSVASIPDKALRDTFEVNFFAQIALTQALLPLIKKSNAGRIVNLSSILGSLTLHSKADSGLAAIKPFAYNASKTALNQFTVHLAAALADTGIKVNSAHPGWVKTDLGGDQAPLNVVEGAETGVLLALLDADGPTGKFFHMDDEIPW